MGEARGKAPVPRFCRSFRRMDVAVDHLKVGQSPKIEQSRPRHPPVFAPDPKNGEAMVNFGVSLDVRSVDLRMESSSTIMRPRGALPICTIIM